MFIDIYLIAILIFQRDTARYFADSTEHREPTSGVHNQGHEEMGKR